MAVFTGGAGPNTITGSADADQIYGYGGNDTLNGLGGDDRVFGGVGDDVVNGGDGNDWVRGLGGIDVVSGGAGNDTLIDWFGGDQLLGGTGDDLYWVRSSSTTITENVGEGTDTIRLRWYAETEFTIPDNVENVELARGVGSLGILRGSEGADSIIYSGPRIFGDTGLTIYGNSGDDIIGLAGGVTIYGGEGDDRVSGGRPGSDAIVYGGNGNDIVSGSGSLFGDAGNDVLTSTGGDTLDGGSGDDVLNGLFSNDVLIGGEGNDTLDGGGLADVLIGGAGQDELTGGLGLDTFRFEEGDFSGATAYEADRITDFNANAKDLIDLSAVDAVAGTTEDEAFDFIGAAAFSGSAGELRYETDGSDTVIYGDTDGDAVADFAITLTGDHGLAYTDFVL